MEGYRFWVEPPCIGHYRKYPAPRIVTNIIEKTVCKAENSNDVFNPSPMLLVRKNKHITEEGNCFE